MKGDIMPEYQNYIMQILNTRGRFGCGEEYHERHHIVPRCMGGADTEDNLIDLYAREHFIAHKLLVEENPSNKRLCYALWAMAGLQNKTESHKGMCSPEEYEYAKRVMSESRRGSKATPETKLKLSKMLMGHPVSEETKQKLSMSKMGEKNPNYGKSLSTETRRKMSKSRTGEKNHNYGKHWTDSVETVQKRAESNKKDIEQYDLYGNLVAQYHGIVEASIVTGIEKTSICKVCKGVRKTAGGYIWRYASEIEGGDAYAVRS